MQNGYIEQIGTPLELYDEPANEFVATFIGAPSMNLMPGVLKNGIVTIGNQQFPGPDGESEKSVNIGVRPEHLSLSDDGLPMRVSVVEPTGSETMVFLNYAGQDVVAVFRERHHFEPGQTVNVKPDPAHVHFFNAENGKRL